LPIKYFLYILTNLSYTTPNYKGKPLKKKLLHFLLLFSLFFNIAHATVIAMEEDCHHDSVSEYVLDTHVDDDCGDLCELHHLFHFMAILDTSLIDFNISMIATKLIQVSLQYCPPFKQTTIKPPIA